MGTNKLRGYSILLILFFLFNVYQANAENVSNSCHIFLNSTQLNSQYYLSYVFGSDQQFNKKSNSEIRDMIAEIETRLLANPSDVNLLNAYWYASDLSSSRSLEMRTRRLDVIQRLEIILGTSEELQYRLFKSYTDLKEYEVAFSIIFKLTKEFPLNLSYRISRIKTNMNLREFDRAAQLSIDELTLNPQNIVLLRIVSESLVMQAKSLRPVDKGNKNKKMKAYENVELYLKQLFVIEKQSGKFYFLYIESLIGQQTREKYQEALDYMNYSGVVLETQYMMFLSAKAYLGLKDFNQAEQLIEKLLAIAPQNKEYNLLKRWHDEMILKLNNLGSVSEDFGSVDGEFVIPYFNKY